MTNEIRNPKSEIETAPARTEELAEKWRPKNSGMNEKVSSQPQSDAPIVAPAPTPAVVLRAPRPQAQTAAEAAAPLRQPRRLPHYQTGLARSSLSPALLYAPKRTEN